MSLLPGFVTGGAAVPEIPGDPAELRAAAAQFGAAAQWLGALSHEVTGTQGQLAGSWSGLAATLAESACAQVSVPVHEAQSAYLDTAAALTRFAEALETAQREADAARGAADEASHAAIRALARAGEVEADPHADPALLARAHAHVSDAQGQASQAVARGQAAYERAQQAAQAAGKAFSAIAGRAPHPPPPPPPPPKPDGGHHGVLGFLEHWGGKAVGAALGPLGLTGQIADATSGGHSARWIPGTQAFNQDVVVGASDTVVGSAQGAWTLFKASNGLYGAIDRGGQQRAQQHLAQGLDYAAQHPWQTGKQILGIDDLEHGQPGKFYGQAGVAAVTAILTDGLGEAGSATAGTARGLRQVGRAASDVAKTDAAPERQFVTTPRGRTFDIPGDWKPRTADNGSGIVYQRTGAHGNAESIRIMAPTPRYPNGYFVYYNHAGQPLDVFGKPGPRSATHIPEDYKGALPAWPR